MAYLSRIILALFILISVSCVATAYIITIDAPPSVTVGSPLVVTGSTSFPENTYFDLVLYYSKYTAGEVMRQRVIVDKTKEFRTDFETRGLEKGQYKVEVHSIFSDGKDFVENSLGSSSVTRRVVQLVDRSDELIMESPSSQNLSDALVVSGRVRKLGDGVVTLRAFGPDTFTFGPLQLITTPGYADSDGHFSTRIPVIVPGEYQVSISDKDGFISETPFNVTNGDEIKEEQVTPTQPAVSTPLPSPPQTYSTPAVPAEPTAKSPLYPGIALIGVFAGYAIYRRNE